MNPNMCPRCEETSIKTTISPERKIKINPETNILQVGDARIDECMFCHWKSTATWNGHMWQWVTSSPLSSKQRDNLMLRLEKIKRRRRAFGGKGR